MKKRYLFMVLVGLVVSASTTIAKDCVSDAVPCLGPMTQTGEGCSDTCPPQSTTIGCCGYTLWRVNCYVGPDQWFFLRGCEMTKNCNDPIIPNRFKCTVL